MKDGILAMGRAMDMIKRLKAKHKRYKFHLPRGNDLKCSTRRLMVVAVVSDGTDSFSAGRIISNTMNEYYPEKDCQVTVYHFHQWLKLKSGLAV